MAGGGGERVSRDRLCGDAGAGWDDVCGDGGEPVVQFYGLVEWFVVCGVGGGDQCIGVGGVDGVGVGDSLSRVDHVECRNVVVA